MNEKNKRILIENIEDKDSNLKGINFEYLPNGITVLIGENNVGKTNLLNWLFENPGFIKKETTDPFLQGASSNQERTRNLNKTWLNSSVIVKHPSVTKVFYSIFYLDIETSFYNFSPKLSSKKIIGQFRWKLIKDCINGEEMNRRSDKPEIDIREWTEEALKIDLKDNLDIIIENEKEGGNNSLKIKAINGRKIHSSKNTGSGNWRFWLLNIFSNLVKEFHKEKAKEETEGKYISKSLLLIDEPELFLHPQRIKETANLIKEILEKKETTIILTTHSSDFLSHFIHDEKETTNLLIAKKENGYLKIPFYLQDFFLDEKIREKIEKEYKNFIGVKKEDFKKDNSYISKWKRLFNQETLRIFFAKNVLFVEGTTDYLLFNNILREKLEKELSEVEIIPMFGKFHYIFFYELGKWLGIKYWFFLDEDTLKDKNEMVDWKNNESKVFWEKYGEGKAKKESLLNDEIIHSTEGEESPRISWIPFDLETFLGIKTSSKDKEHNIISRADDVLKNLNDKKLESLKKVFSFSKK